MDSGKDQLIQQNGVVDVTLYTLSLQAQGPANPAGLCLCNERKLKHRLERIPGTELHLPARTQWVNRIGCCWADQVNVGSPVAGVGCPGQSNGSRRVERVRREVVVA